MSLISYAENFEDVMLWRALQHVKHGFYIDVGAFSPNIESITKFFYAQKNWKGINIEPNSAQYNEFLSARPKDINLQVAISDQEGYLELNTIRDKSITPKNTGLPTLDKTIVQAHAANDYTAEIEKIKVTLANLYEKYVASSQEVHFMKIDVEGFEKKVILGNKWSHYQPWVVLVEVISPINYQETYQNWEHLLTSAGYFFVYSDRLNRFYISPKHPELRSAFKYPPNIFDRFLIHSQGNALTTHLEAKVNSLLTSTSWKITKPLRIFSRLFQSMIHRLKNLFFHLAAKNLRK